MRELLNYRGAFNVVSEYLESGEPVTEGLIREIHKRLVEGVRGGQGGPGAYRKVQNYVANSLTREIIYTPPPPVEVPPLMQELVAWLRGETAGYDFKRLFTLSEFYDKDRSAFYRAIQSVREQGMDLTGWLEFFVGGLATQLDEVKARGEIAIRSDVVARQHRLNPRQAGALDHLLAHGKLTIRRPGTQLSRNQPPHLATGSQGHARQGFASGGGNWNNRP